ncbi:MAG: inositol-3-phosphate synthase [Bdellovibrionota bacterium]
MLRSSPGSAPLLNGAPNLTVDIPAMIQLANEGVPISGKDFKTGQTFMKTLLAPGLKSRMLGLDGWFSTNILGNRDGEVLDAPENFKTKEESKLSVLEHILQPNLYPELYKDFDHKVRINYYPPRGDNKEGRTILISLVGSIIKCKSKSISYVRIQFLAAPLM